MPDTGNNAFEHLRRDQLADPHAYLTRFLARLDSLIETDVEIAAIGLKHADPVIEDTFRDSVSPLADIRASVAAQLAQCSEAFARDPVDTSLADRRWHERGLL